MVRNYKVTKSAFYSEEKKGLCSSYNFEYHNKKYGWREARNYDTRQMLKNIVIDNPSALGFIIQIERL